LTPSWDVGGVQMSRVSVIVVDGEVVSRIS